CIVSHENLHLPFRKGLYVEIFRSILLVLALRRGARLLVPFVNEYALLCQAVTSLRNFFLGGGADEVTSRLFVAGAQDDGGVRSRRDLFLVAAAGLHNWGPAWHGAQT